MTPCAWRRCAPAAPRRCCSSASGPTAAPRCSPPWRGPRSRPAATGAAARAPRSVTSSSSSPATPSSSTWPPPTASSSTSCTSAASPSGEPPRSGRPAASAAASRRPAAGCWRPRCARAQTFVRRFVYVRRRGVLLFTAPHAATAGTAAVGDLVPHPIESGPMALRMTTAGESHGPGLTCVVEGLPAGLELDREPIDGDMARRQLGHGRGGRMKIERDSAQVTSGVRHGRTLGGPIALQVANRDYANWEDRMNPWPVEAEIPEVHLPRPGHADLVGVWKYGFSDVRNVLERASARETAARVAGGALAKAFLRALGVEIRSHVVVDRARAASSATQPPALGGLRGRRRRSGPLPGPRRLARRWSPTSTSSGRPTSRSAASSRSSRSASTPGPRLARRVGGAPRRPPGRRAVLDPGGQGRRVRRRLRRRRGPGLGGPRRDLLLRRSAATTARPTTPAASRAA